MAWQDEVTSMFSGRKDGKLWNDLYRSNPVTFEEHLFQSRRDFTVNYVLSHSTPDSTIIDVGCGAAPVVSRLLANDRDCIGLDYSFDMLRFSRDVLNQSQQHNTALLQADCQALPFPDNHFDIIVCLGVISYIQDYQPALKELYRILKPDGTLIISFRNTYNPVLFDPIIGLKTFVKWLLRKHEDDNSVGRFLKFKAVRSDIEREGFEYLAHTSIGMGPFRWNGKPVFSHRRSIKFDRAIDRFLKSVHLHSSLGKWLSDVSLWIYRKPNNNL